MSQAHEALVARRFDALERRFKATVGPEDYRLVAIREKLGSLEGLRLLDLGCGKGRFATHLRAGGASVIGLDVAPAMLRGAPEAFARVQGTALRLPFADGVFDAVVAIEVIQHWPTVGVEQGLDECRRVLRPGGQILIVDRNAAALNSQRPWLPALVVKRLDEWRGFAMYRPGESARESWAWPSALKRQLARRFKEVSIRFLISPDEASRAIFRWFPKFRSMILWSARVPGGLG